MELGGRAKARFGAETRTKTKPLYHRRKCMLLKIGILRTFIRQ